MTKYLVKGQGYGGGGPSVSPFESSNLAEVKERISELIESDHAVQLYKIDEDGVKTQIEFNYYTTVNVEIYEE